MSYPSLQEDQVTIFQQLSLEQPETWLGNIPKNWANHIDQNLGEMYDLPEKIINRHQLIEIWKSNSCSVEKAFLCTMAWGGMKLDNARRIWEKRSEVMPICENIRNNKYTRLEAFEVFRSMRTNNKLPGMGPAYYTKIIFFASQLADAYILDQWTARSIHMLTKQRSWPSVQIDHTSKKKAEKTLRYQELRVTVTDRVTSEDYEQYCKLVEELARILKLPSHAVEERMFGKGGKSPSLWREHLMNNWHSLPLLLGARHC